MHHFKGLQLLAFVIVMGPLIWFSQRMGWGPTGTFVCVVIGMVLGFVVLVGGKGVSRQVARTFKEGRQGAAADFLLGPTEPGARHYEYYHMQQHAHHRAGEWNAPALPLRQPMLPHPQKRPGSGYDMRSSQYTPSYVPPAPRMLQMTQGMPPIATAPQSAHVATSSYSVQSTPRMPRQSGGALLELGPGAQIYLQMGVTGSLVIDAQLRRPAAPVFLEEWIRHGLGLLVIDLYGQYTGYLAQMSASFGFLAGSSVGQERLTTVQQGRYMALETTRDATHVGQNIVEEGLQVIFNFASYEHTTDAGTYLLALLAGIERKARGFTTKPCAILLTDIRPLMPANEADCVIGNAGVAQQVFDQLMTLLEHAGQPGLQHLAVYLSTPSVEGIEEETLVACRLWVVNCTQDDELDRLGQYLELSEEELEQLQDGDSMLFDALEGVATFVRFRRAAIVLSKPTLSAQRNTNTLPEDERLGGESGLRAKEQE
jgi:hypothetical protein